MNTEQPEVPKGLSRRQAAYASLTLAWSLYLPFAEPPSKLHMASWLNVTDDNWLVVIDVIEAVSKDESCCDPEREIWRQRASSIRGTPAPTQHVVLTTATA